jgi:hypothetical protein
MRFGGRPTRPAIHGFVAVDARVALQDITLDGNTWRESARVEREPYVATLAIGLAVHWRGWQGTLGTTYRTREYATETGDTSFGTLTIRRAVARP